MNDVNTTGPIHADAPQNSREQGPPIPDFDAIGRSMNYASGASLFAAWEYAESIGPMTKSVCRKDLVIWGF